MAHFVIASWPVSVTVSPVTVKFLKIQTPEKIAVITLKFGQRGFTVVE